MKWVFVLLGLLYALMPLDFIPDLIAGLGWLDDLLLAGLVWYWFFRRPGNASRGTASAEGEASEDAGPQNRRSSSGSAGGTSQGRTEDPYQVLGLDRGAGQDEVRAAYRRLAAQYHPDKVAHLGEEFQRLAELKFKAIQAAYDQLRGRS